MQQIRTNLSPLQLKGQYSLYFWASLYTEDDDNCHTEIRIHEYKSPHQRNAGTRTREIWVKAKNAT